MGDEADFLEDQAESSPYETATEEQLFDAVSDKQAKKHLIWKSKKDILYVVDDMSIQHLQNSIKFLERRIKNSKSWIKVFKNQLRLTKRLTKTKQ